MSIIIENLEIASVANRVYAILLDTFLVAIPVFFGMPAIFIWLGIEDIGRPFYIVSIPFALIFYEPIFVSFLGQTLGHKLIGIEVINYEGGRITFLQAIIRFITKWFLGILSLLSLMGSSQAIHDMISKSYVIKRQKP